MSTIQSKTYLGLSEGSVIISRPLHELRSHLQKFELPDFGLLYRVAKVCALALFRGHFYDTDVVIIRAEGWYIHSMHGKMDVLPPLRKELTDRDLCIVNNGIAFEMRVNVQDSFKKSEIDKLKTLSLDKIVTYYRDTLKTVYFSNQSTFWNNDHFNQIHLLPVTRE